MGSRNDRNLEPRGKLIRIPLRLEISRASRPSPDCECNHDAWAPTPPRSSQRGGISELGIQRFRFELMAKGNKIPGDKLGGPLACRAKSTQSRIWGEGLLGGILFFLITVHKVLDVSDPEGVARCRYKNLAPNVGLWGVMVVVVVYRGIHVRFQKSHVQLWYFDPEY